MTGFKSNIVDKSRDESKIRVEPRCQLSLGPENVSPKVTAKKGCTELLTWKIIAAVMGLSLVTVVILTAALLSSRADEPVSASIPQILSETDELLTKLRFVEREEWGAQPSTEPLEKMQLPVPYVIISHTATDFCTTQSECTFRVRFAQTFHIESRNWSDIAWSFLIGGDGFAYVGRSWKYVGAHSYGYNIRSIGISFIGTFNKVIPPQKQLDAAQQLIEFGVKIGKIASDYKLLGQRQISKTLSPGDALYDVIKTWPHWSPTP